MVEDYKQLKAWQRSMDLVVSVYELSKRFPADERFGLTNQVRRASISVPSNIAEGQGRGTDVEFARFLRIANGSRQEVETQLIAAIMLNFISESQAAPTLELVGEVGRITSGLRRSLGA